MFVQNRSSLGPVLKRGILVGDVAALVVSVELVFDIRADGALVVAADAPRKDGDPPDIRDTLLWRGTSVTAFGHVAGPARPPYARKVRLVAAGRALELAVFGERYWEKGPGDRFTQAPAARFDAIPLSWCHAFGGAVELAPGYFPGTELPHPGGTVANPLNPGGRGLIVDRSRAHGAALPNIEDPARLMTHPFDAPTPAGIAPCPALTALRALGMTEGGSGTVTENLDRVMHLQHHAPSGMIFREPLGAGAPIEIAGLGAEPIATRVPASPIVVTLRARSSDEVAPPRVRSVHVDANARQLRVTWGHFRRYDVRHAPRFVAVKEAA
jgi:hypothetical protein